MMKFVCALGHILPVVTLTTLVTLAAPPTLKIEVGFRKLSDPATPPSLKTAAESVFEVRIPYEKDISLYYFDIKNGQGDMVLENVRTQNSYDEQGQQVVSEQIYNCQQERTLTKCPLLIYLNRGTAFIAGTGTQLWTNAHIVAPYLEMKAELEGMTVLELLEQPLFVPIFLFDQAGQLVFNPFVNRPRIVAFGRPSKLAKARKKWFAEDSDYVLIELEQPIGQPLQFAKYFGPNELIYRPGYPACTGCAQNIEKEPGKENPKDRTEYTNPGANSDGHGLYWSRGPLLNASLALQYFGVSHKVASVTRLEDMLFFSAEAYAGMSGGPMLNPQGKVIGLFSGFKAWKNDDGSLSVLSRGVRPPEFDSNK